MNNENAKNNIDKELKEILDGLLKYQESIFIEIKEEEGSLVLKTKNNLIFIIANIIVNKNGLWARIKLIGQGGLIYSDIVSLHSGKSRKQFVNKCLNMKGHQEIDPLDLEKYMLAIEEIVREKDLEAREYTNHKKKTPDMTPAEIEEAIAFLTDPNMIDILRHDLTQLGHVGEELNKLLLYIICTSRKSKKPLACAIKGQSSSGKNSLVLAVLSLMPEEEKKVITRLTPSALYYIAKDGLVHSILCIAEKIGSEAADYPVRSLISEGNLINWVVVKNQHTGQFETQEIVVPGPTVYLETTTQLITNDENATRMVFIYIDDSEEQTKRIHEVQRREKTLDGLIEEEVRNQIKRKHQNAQRLLKVLNVVIPYANHLIFPTGSIRTRRDNEKFLTLIIAIALLRQFQKEIKYKNNIAYIEADLVDYQLAYELCKTVLSQTLDEVSVKGRELMTIINSMVSEWLINKEKDLELYNEDMGRVLTNVVLTRSDVKNYLGNSARIWSDALLHACMRELGHHDLLRVIQGGQGKTYKYTLLDSTQNTNQVVDKLLTPEELELRLDSQTLQ